MNSNEKNLNVANDPKIRKPSSPAKETIRRSVGVSQIYNKAREQTELDVSTAMTKRLSSVQAEKFPQIHESRGKGLIEKHCAEKLDRAVTKIVRNPRGRIKEKGKYSKGLISSNNKSNASSSCKQQTTLKTGRETVVNDLNGSISKKTPYKTNKVTNLSKAKERPCQEKDYHGRREVWSRPVSKELEKVNRTYRSRYAKKDSEQVNVKEKIKADIKCTVNNSKDLDKSRQTTKINSREVVEVGKTLCKKAVGNDKDINANIERNGAARTRIFKRKKSSQVDSNVINYEDDFYKKKAENSMNKVENVNPLRGDEEKRNERENKSSESPKHTCKMDSIKSSCSIKDDKIISLYNGGLTTLESSSDCNQYQEFGETSIEPVIEKANSSFATSSEINYEPRLLSDTGIYLHQTNLSTLSEGTEIHWSNKESKKDEQEFIIDSTKILDHGYERVEKSLTVSKIPSVSQDEITYHTNLMNYGYHSDQQYCKRPTKQQNKNYTADTVRKLNKVDGNKTVLNQDAKYNLMKALIQPATGIHNFRGTDQNVSESLISRQRSKCIVTRKDEGLENCYTHSLTNGSMNDKDSRLSSSVKASQDNSKYLESCENWSPCTSAISLKQLSSTSSEHIAMNLKIKGCKYTKKYRHFKNKDKNACCNMGCYIKRIVSNERKYQEFAKTGSLEREEVKIIIDENSPKTSKIRIVNDRSSVSVVCYSSGRTVSPTEINNNTAANKSESSGGESSGYKSFHNNSHMKDFDLFDQIEIESKGQNEIKHSAIIESHNPQNIRIQHYNPFINNETLAEPICHKSDINSSANITEPMYVDDSVRRCSYEIEDLGSQQPNMYEKDHIKQDKEFKYTSYDTNNYLSTFTNYMDVYLPCEIMAYQFEERNRSKILQFHNEELVDKDVDNTELHTIGKYLTDKNLDTNVELSNKEDFSDESDSVQDITTLENEVIMLKAPDDSKYKSLEFIVTERLREPDNPGKRSVSTDILTVPGQFRIVTSPLDRKLEEKTDSSKISTNISHIKFSTKNYPSARDMKSNKNDITTNRSSTTFHQTPHEATKDTYKRSETYGNTCLGRLKNKNERANDPNTVHELWTNKKSNIDSTDNDSQISGRSHCGKSDLKKHNTNKFKFNIFKKLKSSASEKTIDVRLDQLPKPPLSFLESSSLSQSTIYSSTGNTDASESDITPKPHANAASILRTNSLTKTHVDTAPIHYARKTQKDTVSNENIDHSRFQTNDPRRVSVELKGRETQPESSAASSSNKRSLDRLQEQHSAVPPPASALPPPYPFCCPFVPYMMQYWQNDQQPPPASRVPLPETEWKPNISTVDREPPSPGMVPIPWFPPMMQINNPPQSGEMESRMSNSLHEQTPPNWLMMPRGYAPCLPCSKTTEMYSRKRDSPIHEDDESALEISENKQDGRRKKVSNKLFKIFRRKNRADMDTVDEDEKRAKHHRSRSVTKLDNEHLVQNDQRYSDDRNIWESPDIAGIVTPEEIGRCFRRGFRADGLTLSGDDYLCTKAPSETTSEPEDIFNFSDHDTPLDFLLALGFSVDEATAAIRDDEVRSRFKAALTEARIWVPHIATTQGTLLYLLAMKAKPKVMRYFLQLVESIVNKRITNAVKLDGISMKLKLTARVSSQRCFSFITQDESFSAYLKILEKVEEGYVSFVTLFGKDTGKDDEEDTVIVEKQRRRIFYTIYKYAESEAKEVDQPLTKASVDLLHSLAARYRSAIGPHLRLLACYIGEGLLTKDVQLEAALIYLSRLDSADVQLADLEKYCGLPPSERRRLEKIAKIES